VEKLISVYESPILEFSEIPSLFSEFASYIGVNVFDHVTVQKVKGKSVHVTDDPSKFEKGAVFVIIKGLCHYTINTLKSASFTKHVVHLSEHTAESTRTFWSKRASVIIVTFRKLKGIVPFEFSYKNNVSYTLSTIADNDLVLCGVKRKQKIN